MFVVIDALHSAYGNVRKTSVGMSANIVLRRALARLTLILSMVNLSSPRSSVLEMTRGMYLEDAVAE